MILVFFVTSGQILKTFCMLLHCILFCIFRSVCYTSDKMSDTEGKAISDKESTKGDEKDRVRNIVKSLSLSLSL